MIRRYSDKREPLFKSLDIVTILPDGSRLTQRLRAPQGKGFTDIDRERSLYQYAEQLEKTGIDFKLCPIAGGKQFNFVAQPPAEQATVETINVSSSEWEG